MRIAFLSTIHHRAHEYIKNEFDYQIWISNHIVKRLFYFKNATRLLKFFDLAVIETIYSLAYFWKYKDLFEINFIPIVTSFPYVFLNQPEWYFNDIRAVGIKVPKSLRKKILIRAYKLTKNRSSGYICVSSLVQKMLKIIDDKPSIVVYPSMDPENIKDIDSITGLSFPKGIFSYLGSGPQKGVDITIQVAKYTLRECPEAMFYFRVSKHVYKLYKKQFSELSKEFGNKIRLIFHRIPWKAIRSRASVYLQTSYIEPFGVAVAEAMYAKMIPIVTDTVGAKELFESQYPKLVSSLNPEEISKKLIDVLSLSDAFKQSMATNLHKIAQKLKPENLVKEFKIKFEKLLDEI
jgi:glycosyltransferase involved in cell wall biosynthesis